MTMLTSSMAWNLESLFAGGSSSSAYAAFVGETEAAAAEQLAQLKSAAPSEAAVPEQLSVWTDRLQRLLARLREADAFVLCLRAHQTFDAQANVWQERITTLSARYEQALDLYGAELAKVPDDVWEAWVGAAAQQPVAFALRERREATRDKLPPQLEAVASELAVDGYHGWGEHYQTIVRRIAIPWEENGETKLLSAGQASNKLDDPDPAVRDRMFALWEKAWAEQADIGADTLNRLAGFRLKLNELRGWTDPLREPLRMNRMSRATLDAMWGAVHGAMPQVKRYMQTKAQLLGKPRLDWLDPDAPLFAGTSLISYEEAAGIIVGSFREFSPRMAAMAERAFQEGWIEAEDRPGKRPGAFCTNFPLKAEPRLFLTYSGTPGNLSLLAHELGHAYHSYIMFGLPPFAQEYALIVAETASTFAEWLVFEALLRKAGSDEEKLSLLDERLQRVTDFFMNMRTRFLFEEKFFARRPAGMLDAAQLGELMVEAQREAYGDALGALHPHFWLAKLHFYLTGVPFYNFPYTFGYLFSTGLVAMAQREGPSFSEKYDRLLMDTASMTVEDLAFTHLGVRLDEPKFWEDAVAYAIGDVEPFIKLAEASKR